jgi:acetolactate synthase-1/3 small subunit
VQDSRHILSILVRNRAGVMSHVSGLFTRRGYNIDSIAVGVTDKPEMSIITIVFKGDENTLHQFSEQLLKLADVIEVRVLSYHDSIVRELMLVRIRAREEDRTEIFGIIEVFQGRIAEIKTDSMLIEINGSARQISGFIKMMHKFGILEMARTGQVALAYHDDENNF